MKILTSAQMAETDRRTATDFGISLQQLMENAGASVAHFTLRQYPAANNILVLCGKGNNGGDGFVAARHLQQAGRQVSILALFDSPGDLKGEAATAFAALPLIPITFATENFTLPKADLYLDAVLGTGSNHLFAG